MTLAQFTAYAIILLGIYGVLAKRDLLRVLISISILLSGISLLLVSMARTPEQAAMAYSFVIFIWVVEVMEIIVVLALFLQLKRAGKDMLAEWGELRW